jgi:hypothetical protein
MHPSLPISLNVRPDEELEASNLTHLVINAYSIAMAVSRNEKKAFDSAVRAWRERNPNASPEQGPPAVATIICQKL